MWPRKGAGASLPKSNGRALSVVAGLVPAIHAEPLRASLLGLQSRCGFPSFIS
jgi:hypothetical protein